MNKITIMISAAGDPCIGGLIKCYKNNGERKIRIIGVDMRNDTTLNYLFDKFYCVPRVTDDKYCDVIYDICKKEKVDIYIPFISEEMETLLENSSRFKKIGVRIASSDINAIRIANDKLKTYQILKDNNVLVPKFYPVNNLDDFENGCKYMGYPKNPVCLKIVSSSGSRGVRIIDPNRDMYDNFLHEKPNSFFSSYDEVHNMLKKVKKFEKMMLTEYLPGIEYSVDILADHGKVIYQIGRDNIPGSTNGTHDSVIIKNDVAYEVSAKLVKLLKLDGNVGFDFLKNKDGIPMISDINPRLTATVAINKACGVNLPYLRIKQLLGEELPDIKPVEGVYLRRRYEDLFYDKDNKEIKI